MTDTVWIALASLIQPAGLLEAATIVAVVLLTALCARLLTTIGGLGTGLVPVRVRSGSDVRPRSTNRYVDAPGRPQPRAPGCGSTLG